MEVPELGVVIVLETGVRAVVLGVGVLTDLILVLETRLFDETAASKDMKVAWCCVCVRMYTWNG